MPKGQLTSEKKKKALGDAVDWLRNNKPGLDDVDDPTLQALANLAGVPLPHLARIHT